MNKMNKNSFIILITLIFLFITAFTINILYNSSDEIIENKKNMLLNEAKALFNNMVMTRFWNASHNGVYIKKYPGIEPNPYLADNIMTSNKGEIYIRINPAWMTRQISEITNKKSNYYFRITSLKPLNPNNKPDSFESEGLNYFENNKGINYYYKFSDDLNKFDFIGRLNTEKSCLQCHAIQNYKVGDTRGGIRVTIPTSHVSLAVKKIKDERFYFSFLISLFVLTVVIIFIFFINKIFKQQQELKEINLNLENRVKKEVERNVENEFKLNSQQKLVAMGEMVGNIAHQWRQPLSVISVGATGLKMQHEMGILSDSELYNNLDKINENAQYLSQTIDDFKNFIKGDKKAIDFNLKNTVDSLIKLVESSIKKYQISIKLDSDKGLILNGYPNRLIQCLINIFNNTKDAFVENKIPENERFVFISLVEQEDKIIIEFKDNAGGIPDKIIHKIFEPYFTTKDNSRGTGLGLHMTHDLIYKGMNGTIEVSNEFYTYENKEYKGAKFIIILPKTSEENK